MARSNGLLKRLCLWMLPIVAVYGQNIKTGPEVGQQVLAFSAMDQDGRSRTLKSIMGQKGAMLVFFRSADW